MQLSHLDENNYPKMIDISFKESSKRIARASGRIKVGKDAFEAVKKQEVKKGAVLETAILAAIMGAKKTSDLIPMCHQISLSRIKAFVEDDEKDFSFKLIVELACEGKTGVEMEALTGVSIGLLTIYDMLKSIDKNMEISNIILEYKEGGKSAKFKRA